MARYFVELDQEVEIVRNDKVSLPSITEKKPDYIVISPGPCTPNQAGISLELVKNFAGHIPILGVCLGHQTIAQAFGGRIITAKSIQHGMTSPILHANTALFDGVTCPFTATRYHSLVVEPNSLPPEFVISAWVNGIDLDGSPYKEIMAFEHQTLPLCGVQFHPESLMTEFGHQILDNFLKHPNNTRANKSTSIAW